ncbi:putative GNAT family acetyltransferase [Weissella uvarum]|uniref:GNAT family N-acetyltransferase n=1 Tax=Weissella uvarum TaxID=1479233 RepID=UPI001960D308|nr:GNAT family N-acetyltransferase [Weissella uvarum]MBM7616657.1 putative GNAT family acetyltransferase [Weissella uvarum]MCM0594885.1 N-acetyltransferase [Weissella uvarum]
MAQAMKYESGRIFLTDDNDQLVGEIRYTQTDKNHTWPVTHTFVNPAYRGQGIAEQLLDALANLARENEVLLEPVCPYVKQAFMRQSKYADVATPKH